MTTPYLPRLEHVVGIVAMRIWLQKLLKASARGLWVSAVVSLPLAGMDFTFFDVSTGIFLVCVSLPLIAYVVPMLATTRLDRRAAALQIDRWLDSQELVTTALYVRGQQTANAARIRSAAEKLCLAGTTNRPTLRFKGYLPLVIVVFAAFPLMEPGRVPVFADTPGEVVFQTASQTNRYDAAGAPDLPHSGPRPAPMNQDAPRLAPPPGLEPNVWVAERRSEPSPTRRLRGSGGGAASATASADLNSASSQRSPRTRIEQVVVRSTVTDATIMARAEPIELSGAVRPVGQPSHPTVRAATLPEQANAVRGSGALGMWLRNYRRAGTDERIDDDDKP